MVIVYASIAHYSMENNLNSIFFEEPCESKSFSGENVVAKNG